MATIRKFEELVCWQQARMLNKEMQLLIKEKKFKHDYSLIRQIERSAGSIMDNIAEGFERGGNKEFILFLYYAKGSCSELRSQIYRASDADYITKNEFDHIFEITEKVSYLIYKLIQYLKQSEIKGYKFKS
jgi:four helix bundle protein